MSARPQADGEGGAWLPPGAALYFFCVLSGCAAVAVPLLARLGASHADAWLSLAALAGGAAAAAVFASLTVNHEHYELALVPVVAAALLLPPELIVLVPLAQYLGDWLKARREWYVEVFNTCDVALAALAAHGVFRLALDQDALGSARNRYALGALAAVLVFVAVNHLILDVMVHLARGHPFRELGMFSPDNYAPDLVLSAVGVVLAALWRLNPGLIVFALAPLALIRRSLAVPALEAEVRVDPKTGLFNTRHFNAAFAEALERAKREQRPLSLMMVDLDLLRDINNTYGHLAGDAVIREIAAIFRAHLRQQDVPARFGGEEYSVLLPATPLSQAIEIAERIRSAVAAREFRVETTPQPVRATVSIGVSCFPNDGENPTALVHQADLAVYRAKLQGRNRVVCAGPEVAMALSEKVAPGLVIVEDGEHVAPLEPPVALRPAAERRRDRREPGSPGRRSSLPVAVAVAAVGAGSGVAGFAVGSSRAFAGLAVLAVVVALGRALSLEDVEEAISVTAVAAVTGASLFGGRAALLVAAGAAAGSLARRSRYERILFDAGQVAIATLAAAGVFAAAERLPLIGSWAVAVTLGSALAYFFVSTSLLALLSAFEAGAAWWPHWRHRFAWMVAHYLVYGAVAVAAAAGYRALGPYALLVFALPLVLVRRTQERYVARSERSASRLRQVSETISRRNASLEQVNRLLRERSTAAMESLSATVDARDSYTAGHSRRVRDFAVAIGRELGLSQIELDLLGHAALFHDIGKLSIPDAILLKPTSLEVDEWALMRQHAAEGAQIIERLGFLADAVPAIRHHHEWWDGSGYPGGLAGEEIPLGARIIHVADALDSIITNRIYSAARTIDEAIDQLRGGAGRQFCPRCAAAAERVVVRDACAEPRAHERVDARIALSA